MKMSRTMVYSFIIIPAMVLPVYFFVANPINWIIILTIMVSVFGFWTYCLLNPNCLADPEVEQADDTTTFVVFSGPNPAKTFPACSNDEELMTWLAEKKIYKPPMRRMPPHMTVFAINCHSGVVTKYL